MEAIVIETVEQDGIEWGISLTNSNPEGEDYFPMINKETAFRIKERLAIHSPISFNEPFRLPSDKFTGIKV